MPTDPLDTLGALIGSRLKERGERLVSAESCTGGWVAQVVTSVAGSSEWFERGFVTYSNESKQELIGVRAETLARYGAVSEETAREMARGALAASRGTLALAVTGVAGPSGGTPAKPVGMVCFAWADRSGTVRSETRHFTGNREKVRRQSVMRALQGIVEWLDGASARV
jgi:nicotinamide-nucleotide amidase